MEREDGIPNYNNVSELINFSYYGDELHTHQLIGNHQDNATIGPQHELVNNNTSSLDIAHEGASIHENRPNDGQQYRSNWENYSDHKADFRMDLGYRDMMDKEEYSPGKMKNDHPRKFRDDNRNGEGIKNINLEYETKEMKELRDIQNAIKKEFDKRYEAFENKLKKDCELINRKTKKKMNWHIVLLGMEYEELEEMSLEEIMLHARQPVSQDVIPYVAENLDVFTFHKRILKNIGRVQKKINNTRFIKENEHALYSWHNPDSMQLINSNSLPQYYFPSQAEKSEFFEVNNFSHKNFVNRPNTILFSFA
jgi:hypothetical protein